MSLAGLITIKNMFPFFSFYHAIKASSSRRADLALDPTQFTITALDLRRRVVDHIRCNKDKPIFKMWTNVFSSGQLGQYKSIDHFLDEHWTGHPDRQVEGPILQGTSSFLDRDLIVLTTKGRMEFAAASYRLHPDTGVLTPLLSSKPPLILGLRVDHDKRSDGYYIDLWPKHGEDQYFRKMILECIIDFHFRPGSIIKMYSGSIQSSKAPEPIKNGEMDMLAW